MTRARPRPTGPSISFVRLACVALLGAGASACVPVAAWDRERLAHPAMGDAPHADCAGFDAHVRGARESALDPASAGGGGCGCN